LKWLRENVRNLAHDYMVYEMGCQACSLTLRLKGRPRTAVRAWGDQLRAFLVEHIETEHRWLMNEEPGA